MKLIEQLKILSTNVVNFAKRKPVWFWLGVAILTVLVVFTLGGRNSLADYDIESVTRLDLVSLVDVTGKVRSPGKVDLGLERGGKITRIYANVGDKVFAGRTLIITNNSDLWANYEEARVSLAIEQLNLEEVRGTSVIDKDSAFTDLVNALQDSYMSTEDAIYNKIDEIFRGSDSSNSSLGIATDYGNTIDLDLSIGERLDLRYEKNRLEKALEAQRSLVSLASKDNILEMANTAETTLSNAQSFLNKLADAFDGYQTDDLDNRDKVDAQRINLFSARSLVSDALIALRNAKQDYLGEIASLVSTSNGDYLRTALLQQERVNAAQARVNAALADISRTIVKAPFSGMVTKVDTEVGEIVASNSPIISMISDAAFEIEAYIAEADISKALVGSTAKIDLDAYGSQEIFEAVLVFVDPAETVIDGVSTYRALLHFKEQDARILSGMTANIEIVTGEAKGVLSIPQRAVFDRDGKTLVKVSSAGKIIEKEVSIGLKGFDGYVEIKGGLEEGEEVVVFSRD